MSNIKPVVRRDEIVERQAKAHAAAVSAAVERFNQAVLDAATLPFTVPAALLGDLPIVRNEALRLIRAGGWRVTESGDRYEVQ